MVEMDNGNFLIVSGNKITIFDPKTQQFKLPLLQVDHPHPVMQSVIKDKKNNYWIGSKEGGLFCLNFETNTLKTYKEEFSVFRIRNHIWINRLYLDSENKLWIAKGSSSVMDLDNLSIHCLNPTDSLFFYQDVGGFQEDSKGRIWTAGYENGIGFTNFDNFQKGVSHKIDGYFSGVYPYNDSLLWTTGKSLGTINTNTMSYKEIKLSSNNKRLKVEGPVIPTGNGKFIIGCDNGVLIYNPEEQLINNEIPTPYIRKIVSDGKKCYEGNSLTTKDFNFKSGIKHLVFKISSLGFHFSDQITYQYKFESEWQNIGASDEINLTNLSHGDHILKIRACNNLGICNEIPKEYNIIIPTPWWASWWAYIIYLGIAILFADRFYRLRDMVEMDNGNFLIVSGNKITIFDPKTQQFKLPLLQVDHPHPVMQSVIKDKKNNYWIGSKEGGLFCLNFETNTLKTYKEEFSVFRIRNHIWINRLYLDSENKLWIAKGSSSVMDLDNLSIHCLNPTDSLFFYQDVGGFQEDSKGRIWTAGYENGIGFTNFDNFQKGVSHKIDGYFSGVYPYNDSLLWTTGKSLGTINTNTMSYKEIKLSSNNKRLKVEGPVIPTGNGKFIIGCDNGVLIYNPEEQLINNEIPTPYIRKIVSDGKKCYEGNSLTTKDFNFKSGIKHLVFKISSLGFHFSDQITYQYKFESEWQNIGASDEINLTNLSHGDHILKIRACNNLGICNEIPKEYNIIIPTPWWASWWAYIIYLGIAILFADRFYRFQLSKRLAVAESARLKEVNQLRNSLYANITHEFRTPLTVILGMVDAATSNIKDKQLKGAEKALEMIKRNGTSLLRLVNEMLDLSKLESGSMDLQLIQTDVIPFVKYISESFHSLADEKQIGLTVYSEIDEVLMDFDANKLSVIISNVLSNAIKFTQPEGKIIVHLNRISKHNHDFFFIKIKDNGQGIPEEEIQHIFNRFYQIDNSSSRRGEGTGIGLALTKEFVELMDGAIEVKSTSENGSEFTIQIPISNSATQIKDVQIPLSSNLYASASGKEFLHPDPDDKSELPHALIIEDNADVAHYLETCLTGKYQTLHSANGEIGIEMAFDKVPDIIITDVMMPVKDGLEVCSTLKTDERTDHIPIIMLTAKVTMKDRLAGLSYGADAYLTKPFVKAELLTRLDQLVLLRKKIMQKIDNDSFSHFLRTRAENPETKFLQKIIKIIHEEISNHSFGSSVHLSRMMQLSESQIYRKLKAITGKSTAVFIRSVRLQKAKEMIQTTDKTISEVAYDVGFNDPSWFSRAFKEEFGYAPSAISKP